MPIESKTAEIDGYSYEVRQLGALEALEVLDKIKGAAAAALKDVDKLAALQMGDTTITGLAAIGQLAASIDAKDLRFVIDRFGKTTCVHEGDRSPDLIFKGNSSKLDEHFSGRLLSMFKWLGFCCEVNFGDFLGGLRESLSKSAPAKPPAAASAAAS